MSWIEVITCMGCTKPFGTGVCRCANARSWEGSTPVSFDRDGLVHEFGDPFGQPFTLTEGLADATWRRPFGSGTDDTSVLNDDMSTESSIARSRRRERRRSEMGSPIRQTILFMLA